MELMYNIRTEFGIPMKLVRLINICLNETYSRVQGDKDLSDMFPFKNGLKKRRHFIAFASQLFFRVHN
jgi:hypothetical protein